MNRKMLVAVLAGALGVFGSSALAQQKQSRSAQGVQRRDARLQQAMREPASSPGAQAAPRLEDEPYELRPGVWVVPAPYDPSSAAPRVRPFGELGDGPGGDMYDDYCLRYYGPPSDRYGRPAYPYDSSYYGRSRGSYWRGNRLYHTYPYGPYAGDDYDAYEQGRRDADRDYVWFIASQRAGRVLNQWADKFDDGIIMFRDGRYDRALVSLLGAAEKNHADAASRLHAGHALFALGQYDDATAQLARAFELAPSLAHKNYDIRDEYGDKGDFDRHLAALHDWVGRHPNDAGAMTLLGYVTFYSQGPGAAYPCLNRASELDRESYFIPKLLPLARMTSGMQEDRQTPRHQSPERPATREETAPASVQPGPKGRIKGSGAARRV